MIKLLYKALNLVADLLGGMLADLLGSVLAGPIYRRLNAGTRPGGQRARELGLLEG